MSYDQSVPNHYQHGSLLAAIESALPALGKTINSVNIEDLAPVDEFHIGGRLATENLFNQFNFRKDHHILDIGCGLGGAARYVAANYHTQVSGIDLTPEYIETGTELCSWLGLSRKITLTQGSALSMPYEANQFDAGYMLHVGMNIEDKTSLFKEVFRVLKRGSSFGIYDIMRQNEGDLVYPVPWATEADTSKVATPEQYTLALQEAGFEISSITNRGDFAKEFFKQQHSNIKANGGPPPLGLHVLMQQSGKLKIDNVVQNLHNGYIAPVEIIAHKKSVGDN